MPIGQADKYIASVLAFGERATMSAPLSQPGRHATSPRPAEAISPTSSL
jgi:hypothetical protein